MVFHIYMGTPASTDQHYRACTQIGTVLPRMSRACAMQHETHGRAHGCHETERGAQSMPLY
ncbi:hypothetical protein D3W54_09940 [Komagataeibacter medellinensis]|uniref:Transposase n=1 Tax=Komagataeibacter medellinensis TaxID=1177712 RepID=A0ABQ6VXT9_9PROT|nr:hypothetical protein D3W54_09940 [Komagataeibacter medellinensis]